MLIHFENLEEISMEHMYGGLGSVFTRTYMDPLGKIQKIRIPAGGSIGTHEHIISDEICFVMSGTGRAICDGQEELLAPGVCHYCPLGSKHSVINEGNEELILYSALPTLVRK